VVVVVGETVEEEVEETRGFPVMGMTQMILPHPTQTAPKPIDIAPREET
jgi:hypothetical protein